MNIIDFRFRPNTEAILKGISSNPAFKGMCQSIDFNKMFPQTLEEVVEELDRHHVVKAVISGRDCETTYGAQSNNPSVIEFCHKFPDKFIGFAGLDPHKGMAALAEITHAVHEEGIKGAAIDPYLARIYVNDAKYYPIYAKCCELGIPLIIATGPGTLVPNAVIDHVAPRYIDFVARDFPELKIIASHGGYPWVNEMITVAQRNANVYLELSEYEFFPQSSAYIEAANSILSDKIMYASAHPFVDFKLALKNYEQLPLKPEVREKVMYKNAAKVLGLSDGTFSASKAMDAQEVQMIIENVIAQLSQRGLLANR